MTLLRSRPAPSYIAIIVSLIVIHDTNAFLPQYNQPVKQIRFKKVIDRLSQEPALSSCLLTRIKASLGSKEQQTSSRDTRQWWIIII
jgi:hypothetical protein